MTWTVEARVIAPGDLWADASGQCWVRVRLDGKPVAFPTKNAAALWAACRYADGLSRVTELPR